MYKLVDGRMQKVNRKKVKFADQQITDFKQFVFESGHKDRFFNEGRKNWKDRVNREQKAEEQKSKFSVSKENKFAEYSFSLDQQKADSSTKENEVASIDSSLKESNLKKYETKFTSRFEPIKAFHTIKDQYLTKMRKHVENYTSSLRNSCENYKNKASSLKENSTYESIPPKSSIQKSNVTFKTEELTEKKLMPFSTLQPKSVQNSFSKQPYSYFHAISHSHLDVKLQNESSDRIETQSTNIEYEGAPQSKKSKLTVFVKRNDFMRDKNRHNTKSLKSHKNSSERHRTRSNYESYEFNGDLHDRFKTFDADHKEFDNYQLNPQSSAHSYSTINHSS